MLPYKVGDKVVCVDDDLKPRRLRLLRRYGGIRVVKNQIYVVHEISKHPKLNIIGVAIEPSGFYWAPRRFRPLVSPGVVDEIMRKALLSEPSRVDREVVTAD